MNRTQRGTVLGSAFGLGMIFLDGTIVNVALPDIQKGFGVGESGVQWVVAAYAIGMAALIMTSATAADRWGRRRVYMIGLSVFVVASCVCGMAPTLGVLNIARGVQGLAAAAVSVTSLSLVSAAFTNPDEKARAIGIWTGIAAAALGLGPTLGGILTDLVGWRSVFFVTVPVGVAALVLTTGFVAESYDTAKRGLDPVGQVLYIATIMAFAWTVIQGPHAGWRSTSIVTTAMAVVIGLVAFVVWELRHSGPMMDLRLFANRTYTLANVVLFAVLFCFYGILLILTQGWQNVRGASPLITGLALLPIAIGQMIFAPRVGAWMKTVGARRLILIGLSVFTAAMLIGVVGVEVHLGLVIICIALTGIATSFTVTPSTTIAMRSVPEERAGMASGILNAQRALGSAAGYAVLGTIIAAWLGATLNTSLEPVVPNADERAAVASEIIDHANPHAFPAEIGPSRPVPASSGATHEAIADAAEADFKHGIQLALATCGVLTALVLALCWVGFPRDHQPPQPGEPSFAAPTHTPQPN
ncbi:DHA2 family efflux MFS transporter permease subunit [Ilumatobacter sp.]|uniref:DHA2 family efflux MFS transporter permease subunit n=1 Tax=Ilumatobacter sp. TaxID=1967498 RepID=UPI003C4A757A